MSALSEAVTHLQMDTMLTKLPREQFQGKEKATAPATLMSPLSPAS